MNTQEPNGTETVAPSTTRAPDVVIVPSDNTTPVPVIPIPSDPELIAKYQHPYRPSALISEMPDAPANPVVTLPGSLQLFTIIGNDAPLPDVDVTSTESAPINKSAMPEYISPAPSGSVPHGMAYPTVPGREIQDFQNVPGLRLKPQDKITLYN